MNISPNQIPLLNQYMTNNENVEQPIRDSLIKKYNIELQNIPDYQYLSENFEKIFSDLTRMKLGFSHRLILNAFYVYKFRTTEEALHLLEKENDLWNHKFIASDKDQCFICEELEERHKTFNKMTNTEYITKINEDVIKSKYIKKLSEKQAAPTVKEVTAKECQICWSEIPEQNKCYLKCNHQFCVDCVTEYLREDIINFRVENLYCPQFNCKELYSDEQLKKYTTEEDYAKLLKFKERLKFKNDPNYIPCPIINCESFAPKPEFEEILDKIDNLENTELKVEDQNNQNNESSILLNEEGGNSNYNNNTNPAAPSFIPAQPRSQGNIHRNSATKKPVVNVKCVCKVGHEFCYGCRLIWHGQSLCSEDEEVNKYASESGASLKKCPKCNCWTEKNEGCNHMTCKVCNFEWCWLCLEECTPDHYFNEDSPCYGKQFTEGSPEELEFYRFMQEVNSITNSHLFPWLFTSLLISLIVSRIYNRRNITEYPSKCTIFTLFFCIELIMFVLGLMCNGVIVCYMVLNSRYLASNPKSSCMINAMYGFGNFMIWVTFYFFGLILGVVWFFYAWIYTLVKIVNA